MGSGAFASGRVSARLLLGTSFVLMSLAAFASCGGRVIIDDSPSGSSSMPLAGRSAVSPPAPRNPPNASPPNGSMPDASPPDTSPPNMPDASTPDTPDTSMPNGPRPYASTPKQIRCGAGLCDIDDRCCLTRPDDSELSPTLTSCAQSFCSMRRECDETADCSAGEVCCYSIVSSPPAVIGSYCTLAINCGGMTESWVACGPANDCTKAGAAPCLAQKCAGTTLQACGQIPRFACRKL